jgi:hypothetical protein
MAHHELKTWPAYFAAVIEGQKTFEIRNDRDRGFQSGDTITLREYNPCGDIVVLEASEYSGRTHDARVGYVSTWEQKPGYVVFSLLPW